MKCRDMSGPCALACRSGNLPIIASLFFFFFVPSGGNGVSVELSVGTCSCFKHMEGVSADDDYKTTFLGDCGGGKDMQ